MATQTDEPIPEKESPPIDLQAMTEKLVDNELKYVDALVFEKTIKTLAQFIFSLPNNIHDKNWNLSYEIEKVK